MFTNVLNVINQIAANSSQKEKIKIIKENEGNYLFQKVVKYALDPFVHFHVSGRIKSKDKSNPGDINNLFNYLDQLSKQTGVTNKQKEELENLTNNCGTSAVEVINRVLDKDLKCGAAAAIFNKASDKFKIPVHFPMKGISDVDKFLKKFKREEIFWSYKLDGTRCWAVVKPDQPILYLSFNGKELPNFNVFDDEIDQIALNLDYDEFILDGEVVDANGNFTSQMSNFRRLKNVNTSGFRYRVFDIIIPERTISLKYRYQILEENSELPLWNPIDKKEIDNEYKVTLLPHYYLDNQNIDKLLNKSLKYGLEGLMLKYSLGNYEMKRSNYWCKVKKTDTLDLRVINKIEGTGKYKGQLGSLIVDYNGTEVEVGTGYSDEEREDFWKNPPDVIEVRYQEITDKGSLRFPVFMRVRDDKLNN